MGRISLKAVAAAVTVVAAAGLMSGCGGPGADRTVALTMSEFKYSPAAVTVTAGERVRFVFRNEGEAVHDAFVGDAAAQEVREKVPAGEKAPGYLMVEPGRKKSLTHRFERAGTFLIGCHVPGHWKQGMKLTVRVRPAPPTTTGE